MLMPAAAFADGQLKNEDFAIQYGARGITSLKRVQDAYETEYISTGGVLGNIAIQYKTPGDAAWNLAREITLVDEPAAPSPGNNAIKYSIATPGVDKSLKADESFQLDGGTLTWTLTIANQGNVLLEIGDLALPLSMAENTPQAGGKFTLRNSFATHSSRAMAPGHFGSVPTPKVRSW